MSETELISGRHNNTTDLSDRTRILDKELRHQLTGCPAVLIPTVWGATVFMGQVGADEWILNHALLAGSHGLSISCLCLLLGGTIKIVSQKTILK